MKRLYSVLVLAGFAASLFFVTGCAKNPPPGLLDASPLPQSGPPPVVASLSPADSGLGGVSIVTLTGSNFSTVLDQNLVYFDTVRAPVLQATPTELKVRAPRFFKDDVKVKVATLAADLYSNTITYRLQNPVKDFGNVQSFEQPFGMVTDAAGNLYVSLVVNDVGSGIKRYDPIGNRVDFAPRGTETKWNALRIGPGGNFFGVVGTAGIYTFPGTGGAGPRLWKNAGGAAVDLDFDPQGNLWTGRSTGGALVRVSRDSVLKTFTYAGTVKALRYFGGYLYIGGRLTGQIPNRITRVRVLSADSIGSVETVFTLPSSGDTLVTSVYAINFSADGDLFIGTDATNPITVVHPDGTSEPLLATFLSPSLVGFAWGPGRYMYAVQGEASGGAVSRPRKIVRIDMQKTGAPYYGTP